MGSFLIFPLLAISVVLFAILTITGIGSGDDGSWFTIVVAELPLVQDRWTVTFGDLFIVGSLGLLFIELLRSTQTGTDSLINHVLSFITFVIALLLFILAPGFGNSVFFMLVLMTCMDLVAGFIVTTVTARRDFGVAEGVIR
ncbi:MAG: hypothetical protein AAFR11_02805 [Pseudomonadota bacterium]